MNHIILHKSNDNQAHNRTTESALTFGHCYHWLAALGGTFHEFLWYPAAITFSLTPRSPSRAKLTTGGLPSWSGYIAHTLCAIPTKLQ